MGHADPPIRHHNHQIPQAQLEARVPAHAQNDDLSIEVPSFEQIFDRVERLHSSSSPGEGAFAPEPFVLDHFLLYVHLTFSCPDDPDQFSENVRSSGDYYTSW